MKNIHRKGSLSQISLQIMTLSMRFMNCIHVARTFYQECEYSGNIEFYARLQQIDGWKLDLGERSLELQIPSIEPKVSASTQCLAPSFLKVKDCIDVIMDLSDELLWCFAVQNYDWQNDWKNKLEDWFSRSIMSDTQNE